MRISRGVRMMQGERGEMRPTLPPKYIPEYHNA